MFWRITNKCLYVDCLLRADITVSKVSRCVEYCRNSGNMPFCLIICSNVYDKLALNYWLLTQVSGIDQCKAACLN